MQMLNALLKKPKPKHTPPKQNTPKHSISFVNVKGKLKKVPYILNLH